MTKGGSELSTVSILAISLAIAMVGLVAYLLVTPVSPAKLVALEHAALNDSIPR
jgi:hypothetical protein